MKYSSGMNSAMSSGIIGILVAITSKNGGKINERRNGKQNFGGNKGRNWRRMQSFGQGGKKE